MSEVICPRCGRKSSDLARRCQGCGLDLTELSELSGVRRPDLPSELSMPPRNLMHRVSPTIDVGAPKNADDANDVSGVDIELKAPRAVDGDASDDEERDPMEESRINSIPSQLRRMRFLRWAKSIPRIAIVILALGFLWIFFGRHFWPSYQLRADLVRDDQGEFVDLAVTGATAGTTLEFAGEKKTLDSQGRARFPFYVQGLSFGENILDAKITLPSKQKITRNVVIDVPFRVLPFWHRFNFDTHLLPINVQAKPGTQLTINGIVVNVDNREHEAAEVPIAYHDGAWEDWISFHTTVQRSGQTIFDGTLRLYAKKASLNVIAPPMEAVTEAPAITVVGQVGNTADISVQKTSEPVVNGSFEANVPLANLGVQTIDVIAREQGFLPNRLRIPVTRVASLREAYAEYRIDSEVNWPELWKEPAKFVGARIELTGAVTQVVSNLGGILFELKVEPCLSSDECLFWVNYPMLQSLQVDEQVHVRGRVAGERPTYVDQQGQSMRNRPLLEAAFVLQQSD